MEAIFSLFFIMRFSQEDGLLEINSYMLAASYFFSYFIFVRLHKFHKILYNFSRLENNKNNNWQLSQTNLAWNNSMKKSIKKTEMNFHDMLFLI